MTNADLQDKPTRGRKTSSAEEAGRKLGSFIRRLEGTPGSPTSWALVFFGVTFLRAFLEGVLEESQVLGFRLETLNSLEMTFLHSPLFYLTTFSLATLVLSMLARTPVSETAKVLIIFSPIVLLAPLVDASIYPHGIKLHYFRDPRAVLETFIYSFCPFTNLEGVSPGMRLEVFLGSIGGGLYVFAKRRKLPWMLAGFVAVYFTAVFAGSIPAFFSLLVRSGGMESRIFQEGGIVFSDSRKYALVHLLVATTILSAAYLRAKRSSTRKVLLSLRPFRSVFYLFATGFGILLGAVFLRAYYPEFSDDPFLVPAILGALGSIFFIFQSQLLLNDFFDRKIDPVSSKRTYLSSELLTIGEAKVTGAMAAGLSLLFAATLGYATFLIALVAHVLGFFYSSPPCRLKRFFPLNALLISLSVISAAYLGFSIFGQRHTLAAFPPGVSIFLVLCFFVVSSIKDLPDIEGDRAGGIVTLPTILGERKSRILLSAAVLGAYLSAPLLLRYPVLTVVSAPAGVLSVYFLRKRRERWVFALLFLSVTILGPLAWRGEILKPRKESIEAKVIGTYLRAFDHNSRSNSLKALATLKEAEYFGTGAFNYLTPRLLLKLGKLELQEGNTKEAASSLTTVAERTASEEAYSLAAAALSDLGEYRRAVQLLGSGIRLRPQSARLRLARAAIFMKAEGNGALADLTLAYLCRLDRATVATYLGDLARRMGNNQGAETFYQEALGIDPESLSAWAGIAALRITEGRSIEARKAISKVARILVEEGKPEEARAWRRKAKLLP